MEGPEVVQSRFRAFCFLGREPSGLEAAEIRLGFFKLREEPFVSLKLAGVDAAAAAFYADGMLEVEHLVVEQIFDGAAGCVGTVEDTADHDGVVGGVVVAEHAAGVMRAPGEDGTTEQAMEETGVEGIEDLIQIEVMADWGEDSFAPAGLADVFGLAGDRLGGYVAAVAVGMGRGDGLAIELGEEDVGDGVVHGFGRVLEQVGEADVELALAQADGGVQ
jgi:hypothetical protein